MSFRICFKNVMNVAFLSNKIKNIYSDPKNEDIVKILWYFVVFLNFFFNIIKLGEPKFTISHKIYINFLTTRAVLTTGAARALHVQPTLVYIILYIIKVGLRRRGCAMCLHQIVEILIDFWKINIIFFCSYLFFL